MADHKHGDMDTSVQERTFADFMTFTTRAVIVIMLILIALAVFFR